MLRNLRTSLYSPQTIGERQNRELLLQFLLSEILEAYKACLDEKEWKSILSLHPYFFPYDWASKPGPLNKAYEHSLFLAQCFPDYLPLVKSFQEQFILLLASWQKKEHVPSEECKCALQICFSLIEPLIAVCKENENLLFFLLKYRSTIDSLMGDCYLNQFLHQIYPSGLESLGEKMCDRYHRRGFFSQIAEFKLLLTELTHA